MLSEITDEAIKSLADRTTGQSLAIIENILNISLRSAQKQGKKSDDTILNTAFEDYSYGEKREQSPDYYHKVSIHEAGHAYVHYLEGKIPSYITIESRSSFGGYVQVKKAKNFHPIPKRNFLA